MSESAQTSASLELQREPSTLESTPGVLALGGRFQCYTLEDVVRELPGRPVAEWKLPGVTAVPAGRYRVVPTFSPRFQRQLPLLLDVPGFSGVRIHPGNTARDTEGCILVGGQREPNRVNRSVLAFNLLFAQLQSAWRAGLPVWLSILPASATVAVVQ